MTSLPVCLPLRCHGNTSINSHHWLGHTHTVTPSVNLWMSQFSNILRNIFHIFVWFQRTHTMKLSILKLSSVQILILTGQFYLPTTTYLFRNGLLCVFNRVEGGRDSLKKNEECLRNWFFSLSLLYVMKEDGWLAILQWLLLL